jgi:hypothetical protein
MGVAEISGKLSPANINDRSEDLLTSDVFGTMHFVEDKEPFLRWLSTAVCASIPETTPLSLPPMSATSTVTLRFWPRLDNGREPDLAILIEHGVDVCLLVIEVKYHSGLSNFEPDDSETSSEQALDGHQIIDQVAGMIHSGIDQLAAKWFGSVRGSWSNGKWAHVLVTADRTLPKDHYADVLHYFNCESIGDHVAPAPFWLSWHTLLPTLDQFSGFSNSTDERLYGHLRALLRHKQLGAVAFSAFARIEILEFPISYSFWSGRPWFQSLQAVASNGTQDDDACWWTYPNYE